VPRLLACRQRNGTLMSSNTPWPLTSLLEM
jgi:hypothetical protein